MPWKVESASPIWRILRCQRERSARACRRLTLPLRRTPLSDEAAYDEILSDRYTNAWRSDLPTCRESLLPLFHSFPSAAHILIRLTNIHMPAPSHSTDPAAGSSPFTDSRRSFEQNDSTSDTLSKRTSLSGKSDESGLETVFVPAEERALLAIVRSRDCDQNTMLGKQYVAKARPTSPLVLPELEAGETLRLNSIGKLDHVETVLFTRMLSWSPEAKDIDLDKYTLVANPARISEAAAQRAFRHMRVTFDHTMEQTPSSTSNCDFEAGEPYEIPLKPIEPHEIRLWPCDSQVPGYVKNERSVFVCWLLRER